MIKQNRFESIYRFHSSFTRISCEYQKLRITREHCFGPSMFFAFTKSADNRGRVKTANKKPADNEGRLYYFLSVFEGWPTLWSKNKATTKIDFLFGQGKLFTFFAAFDVSINENGGRTSSVRESFEAPEVNFYQQITRSFCAIFLLPKYYKPIL